jgi:catechol 2,3-dioxygenase-like lactoylglutathione lyase family enzyme
VHELRRASDSALRVQGLDGGELTTVVTTIPRIGATVEISAFAPAASAAPARPFNWRIQDVGAPQFQLEVAGLDALLVRTASAGHRFLSVGGRPIERPFGRFVFAIDPDGVLVEFVEPAAAP